MDKQLAELYGTNQVDETDFEKLAAAEMAEGLAQEEGLDLSQMDPEQIEALAQEVLADESGEGAEVEEPETDEGEEGQEKVAEADYLGRVMAHAYVQELKGIEKEASRAEQRKGFAPYTPGGSQHPNKIKTEKQLNHAIEAGARERSGRKARDSAVAKKKGTFGASVAANEKQVGSASHKAGVAARGFGRKMKEFGGKAGQMAGKVGKHIGRHAVPYSILAAGGAAAAAAHHRKEASALDTLAERRAMEILEANGINPFEQEQEKVAAPEQFDTLAAVVEQRAMEMLEEAGYEFEQDEE